MESPVRSLLASGVTLTDAALERLLPSPGTLPHSIHRAMRHSVFAGGKRLRPILCMEAARMVAGNGELPAGVADLGAALEMLHTYSLIHDDLPALDNDDLRRGHPTCHVAFGEAIAILAGDALQTLAFQTIANLENPVSIRILREVTVAVGTGIGRSGDIDTGLAPGMIGGQVVDIESEGVPPTADLVETIHRAKTGALITTAIVSGGLYGLATKPGAPEPALSLSKGLDSETGVQRLRTFGQKAGLAFQIVDDILDMTQSSEELGKTAGKDTASVKATWPAVYGIERSRADADQLIADAFAALEPFGPAADPLKSLAEYLVDRTH